MSKNYSELGANDIHFSTSLAWLWA